jgi:hypothetical protein
MPKEFPRNERVLEHPAPALGTGPADIRLVNGAALAIGR